MKPEVHSHSSARKFGGAAEDYFEIHQFMDSTKAAFPDNRHRVITHNAWFIGPDGPLERIFGVTIKNSAGRDVSVRDIGEQHCLEDFAGSIPSLQDWIMSINMAPWMSGLGRPPSTTGQPARAGRKSTAVGVND